MSSSPNDVPKGKKMFKCDFCDRFFSTASNMREHRRTHTGEKPFVCKYCGKAFAQSSTHSKHLLVHKTKEKFRSDIGSSVRQTNKQRQEQNLSDPSLARLTVSSTSQFRTESTLLSSKTFVKTLQEPKNSEMKMEVDFYDNLEWGNSSSVLGQRVDTSLQFSNICETVITPAPSFDRVKNIDQRTSTDQKPIITGMFKNRVCEFSSFTQSENLQVKQELVDVKEINLKTSSIPIEPGLSGNGDPIRYENAKRATPPLCIRDVQTINCDDSKAFHSALPSQPILSDSINNQWNGSLEGTTVIELDLTSEGEDTMPETQDKFESNIETFFKCIHCSETFSSLEEHICLAKEAKMFFKCQVCQKTFTQYGPFVRHKKSHKSPEQFTVSSTSNISTYKSEEYKRCDSITVDDIPKGSNEVLQINNNLHLLPAINAGPAVEIRAPSLSFEPSRIQSTIELIEDEQNSNDDVIIIENTVPTQSEHEEVSENFATGFPFSSNSQSEGFCDSVVRNHHSQMEKYEIIEIPDSNIENIANNQEIHTREISTYSNTDQFNNTEGRYFERSNISIGNEGKSQRGTIISEALLKPNAIEKKTGNVTRLEKQQVHLKKNPLKVGKNGHPFTCLFCPRKFSTASNMREHMRTHTGEKPFSCEVCHKKFGQSSTRSKHMQTHTGYKMNGYQFYGKRFALTKNYKKHLRRPGKHYENTKSFLLNRLTNIKEKPKIHPVKSALMKAPSNKSYANLPNLKASRPSFKRYAFQMMPEPSNNFSLPPKAANNKIIPLTAKLERRAGANNDNMHFVHNKESTNRMNNFSLPPKTANNKIIPLTAKLERRVGANNDNIHFVHKESTNRMNNFSLPPKTANNKIIPLTAKLERRVGANNDNIQFEHNKPVANRMNVLNRRTDSIKGHNNDQNSKNKMMIPSTVRPDPHISAFSSSTFENSKTQIGHLPNTTLTLLPRPKSRHRGVHRILRNAKSYRPFRCTYCPRTFSTSGNMKEHMRTHTGEKPFRCEYCHRRFAQSSTHSKHVLIHIRKQQLNCSFCGKIFSRVALLRNHIITDHKTDAGNSTRINNIKNNNPSANLCRSSNIGMVSGTGYSFDANRQMESSLNTIEKNQCSQEPINKIIAIPDSNIENEINSSLTDKRHLERNIPEKYTGFLIPEENNFLSLQGSEKSRTFPENNERKKESPEIPKIGRDSRENLKSCVNEDSKSNLSSSSFAEIACITPQSDSEMVGELLSKQAWHVTSTRARIEQQNQIKSHSPNTFGLPSINSELSSIIELETGKSPDNTNIYREIKPLESLSSMDDLNAKKSFSMEDESNNFTISEDKMVDKIFLNDFSHQNQFINLSTYEIPESCTDSQKKPTKLHISCPPNINEDNLMHYNQTDQLSEQYNVSKVDMHKNILLDKGSKPHPQKVCSPLLRGDHSSSSRSQAECFTLPTLTNNDLVEHFPPMVQIGTINKVRKEALSYSSNREGNYSFVPSQVTSGEQLLRREISFELANHQIKQSLNLNGNISDHNTIEQNVPKLLNFELSQNPCSSDHAKKLNVDRLSDTVPKTKSENKEIISDFVENCYSKILSSKMENSLEEGSAGELSKCIKLESVFVSDNRQGFMAEDEQFENGANSDTIMAVSIRDSLDSSFHFNISKISANVPYSVTAETDRNNGVADNSGPFCHQGETNSLDDEVRTDINTIRISSSESTLSMYADTENQRLPLSGALPNNVEKIPLKEKRKNLQWSKTNGKFKCLHCSRWFTTRSNMHEHMRVHTGERPFECVFCFRRFAQSSTHSRHVQTHLRFRQLVCPQCGKRFPKANNLCQHIRTQHRISHASTTSLTKKLPPRSGPTRLAAQTSSCPIELSPNNKDKHVDSEDLNENNRRDVNVHAMSSKPFEIYKETKTNNEAESFRKLSHLPLLDNEQTTKEMSDDPSKIPTLVILSKDEKTQSTIDIDIEKSNSSIDRYFDTPNKTIQILQDVSFSTNNSNLNQSNLPLNQSRHVLPERNSNPKSLSSSPPVSVFNSTKEKKRSPTLHYHRCLFCCKMFDALINIQECSSNHKGDSSLEYRVDRKLKECSTWYRHMEIVLGRKLRLATTLVGNKQHLKITFDVSERLKMMLHRNLYKCRHCGKECATLQSLLFHRRIHSSKMTGQELPNLVSGKLNKRAQGLNSFLKKRPTCSLVFSLEPVSSNNGENSSMVVNHKEPYKTTLPLLSFSLVNLNGNFEASYSRGLSVDKNPITEIESCKQNYLRNKEDSLQQKSNENVSCSEEKGQNGDPTNKSTSEGNLERQLHFSQNDLEDIDMKTDDSMENGEVLLNQNTPSLVFKNFGVKFFGQGVTTMVSLQRQKCVECGKMFSHARHLEKHSQIHRRKLRFKCKFCFKSFMNFSMFSRHKNLIHSRQNPKSQNRNCRKNKSNCDDRKTSVVQEEVISKYNLTKPQQTSGMNLPDVDTVYLANLLKKVLGGKSAEVFSNSLFVDKLPNEDSTNFSEMMEYSSKLSDRRLTENGRSQPFQSPEINSNVSVIENFKPENNESVDEVTFGEGSDLNGAAWATCVTDNFPATVQIKKEVGENFSSLNNSKAVDVSQASLEIKADVFSHNWQKEEISVEQVMFSSQSSHNVERPIDPKCDSDKQPKMNSRERNDSILVTNTDSNGQFNGKDIKENASVECIFINDDIDDRSQNECCIVDASLNSGEYLTNQNEKTNTANEIIILSDEENDNSSHVKTESFNDGNSMIKLCNDQDFFSKLKEIQTENLPKDDKLFQDVYKSVDMLFENFKSNFPGITGQNRNPNLSCGLEMVSTNPSITSNSATKSSKMADFSLGKTVQPQSSKVHPCLYCSKICSSSSNLKEHMRSHTGERPFSCRVCHKTFAQKSTLSRHSQIHTRFEHFSPVKVTMQKPSVIYHESAEPTPTNLLKPLLNLVEHSNQLINKPVNVDPKYTTLKSNTNFDSLEIHADLCDDFNLINENRSNVNPSVSFKNDQPDLRQSSEIVGNPSSSCYQPISSDIYPLPQSSANVLTCKPILTNPNPIKPSISNVVPETNVPNKPYSCDVCERTFTTSGNLKEHRRTHTGERPFECPFCDKTFVQASTRSRHVKNHSKHFVN